MKNSRSYWNNVEFEKAKKFWIDDPSDTKLLNYLRYETNLEKCFVDSISFAERMNMPLKGRILDIGVGVAWTSAILSRLPQVGNIVALDFSEHRLNKIAPMVFKQYHALEEKIEKKVGDFYDFYWGDSLFDAVIFCQSLYMFRGLRNILLKVNRLLKNGGLLVVSCEDIFQEPKRLSLKWAKRKLLMNLFNLSDISGNYGYVGSDYYKAIQSCGFRYVSQQLDYSVYNSKHNLHSTNHFGIKE